MIEDKAAQEAFARGLIPFVVIETLGVMAGVALYFLTDQPLALVACAVAGGLPLIAYVMRHGRKAGKGGQGRLVE